MKRMLDTVGIDEKEVKIAETWTTDMIVRYFYVHLAPYFRRDINFFLASEEEKARQFCEGFKLKGPDITCQTICMFYKSLLNEFGINSVVIRTNNKTVPHYALVVQNKDYWYYIDPLKDLMPSQLGLKPSFFGTIPQSDCPFIRAQFPYLKTLRSDYIKELDDFLGLLPSGEYIDEFLNRVKLSIQQNNEARKTLGVHFQSYIDLIEAKLTYSEKNLMNLGQISGLYERMQFQDLLRVNIFNKSEKKHIDIYIDSIKRQIIIDVLSRERKRISSFVEVISDEGKYSLKRIL